MVSTVVRCLLLLGAWLCATVDARAEELLARGRYLMNTVVACGNCHTPRGPDGALVPGSELSGGVEIVEPGLFVARASNLTPDPETGLGRWSDAEIGRAIREGVSRDGRVLGPPMPFAFYRGISDYDLAAIIAYLRAVPAKRNAVAPSTYSIPLPPSWGPAIVAPVAAPPRDRSAAYGAYLAGPLGHCTDCHTPLLPTGARDLANLGAGGQPFPGPWGVSAARNLTPHESGLQGWSDAQIERAIRGGVSRDGTRLKPPMAFDFYSRIDAADMAALIAYLRSLPPRPLAGRG